MNMRLISSYKTKQSDKITLQTPLQPRSDGAENTFKSADTASLYMRVKHTFAFLKVASKLRNYI